MRRRNRHLVSRMSAASAVTVVVPSPLAGEGGSTLPRAILGEGCVAATTPHPFELAGTPLCPLPQGERALEGTPAHFDQGAEAGAPWAGTRHTGRRAFITLLGAVAAWPLAAYAQQREPMRRIGFLRAAPPSERELEALLRGLVDHGWVQGRNFVLVPQWGDGNVARLPELAVALVNAGVDIILVEGVVTARAARAVTATIPIVMTAGADPFVGGLVQSLARPGGNVTGFSTLQAEIVGKVLEIFKDMVPGLSRIAALIPRVAWNMFAASQDPAAKALGIDVVYIDLPGPESAGTAMRQAVSAGVQGALLRVGPFFSSAQRQMIVDLAAEVRLPVMYERREYIEQGGLVTYAPASADLYRRAAGYVARILAGANPGELPIEQPTKFELIINLRTAKTLGLDVPPMLLARADEVIE
jgi:putative tryptophan/tyrosine transport system substrate-binding protein